MTTRFTIICLQVKKPIITCGCLPTARYKLFIKKPKGDSLFFSLPQGINPHLFAITANIFLPCISLINSPLKRVSHFPPIKGFCNCSKQFLHSTFLNCLLQLQISLWVGRLTNFQGRIGESYARQIEIAVEIVVTRHDCK
jgi:hypothetical protein